MSQIGRFLPKSDPSLGSAYQPITDVKFALRTAKAANSGSQPDSSISACAGSRLRQKRRSSIIRTVDTRLPSWLIKPKSVAAPIADSSAVMALNNSSVVIAVTPAQYAYVQVATRRDDYRSTISSPLRQPRGKVRDERIEKQSQRKNCAGRQQGSEKLRIPIMEMA